MAKLNKDILHDIFQNLHEIIITNLNNEKNYKDSLHSCLLVNKLWCKVMIPILWSYPYKYVYKKILLFNVIISHLSDNSIKFLKDENIIETDFQKQKLSFNYVKYCKHLNDINEYFPRFTKLKEEIYKLFISECSSIKCLNSSMYHFPLYQYPGANISLSNLYELNCDIGEQNFYHELAQICRSIEKIFVKIEDDQLSGIAKLIEMQKQIKYLYISEFCECEMIAQALEKHVNSIVYLETNTCTTFLHLLWPKLINLQFIRIHEDHDDYYNKSIKTFCEYAMNISYYKLQILELYKISLNKVINIIQNTDGDLWRIKIRNIFCNDYNAKKYNQTIYKYCPNIKYVTLFLKSEGTLEEIKNILINCQHLVAIDVDRTIEEKYLGEFLDLLVELAPLTLYKIHINRIYQLSEESLKLLKLFFNNWNCKGKKTLHLYQHTSAWDKLFKQEWGEFNMEGIVRCDYDNDDFWNHDKMDFWNRENSYSKCDYFLDR
jgi:hypothetical protein